MKRYAMQRDNNEPALLVEARKLGWWLVKTDEPCDWLGFRAGLWNLIEVKNPDCEGHADEYTPKQRIFHNEAKQRRAPILIWRTLEDVIRDSQFRNRSGAEVTS